MEIGKYKIQVVRYRSGKTNTVSQMENRRSIACRKNHYGKPLREYGIIISPTLVVKGEILCIMQKKSQNSFFL